MINMVQQAIYGMRIISRQNADAFVIDSSSRRANTVSCGILIVRCNGNGMKCNTEFGFFTKALDLFT